MLLSDCSVWTTVRIFAEMQGRFEKTLKKTPNALNMVMHSEPKITELLHFFCTKSNCWKNKVQLDFQQKKQERKQQRTKSHSVFILKQTLNPECLCGYMEVRGRLIQHKSRRKWCQQISSSSQEKITLRKLSLECCGVFCACLCAHVRTKIIVILSRWSVLTPSSCVWLQRQTVCAKSLQLNRQPNQALQDTVITRMNAYSTNPALFVIPCNFVLFAHFFSANISPFHTKS